MRNYKAVVVKLISFGGIIFNIGDKVDVTEYEGHPLVYIEMFSEDELLYNALSGVPKEMVQEICPGSSAG